MSKQRNLRKKRQVEELIEEEDETQKQIDAVAQEKIQATRLLQKHRQRSQGLGAKELAGERAKDTLESTLGLRAGNTEQLLEGYVNEQAFKQKDKPDPEREKYVEEQLRKRLGKEVPAGDCAAPIKADDLYAIPQALRAQKTVQEDVSAWMTGIVEVPLSVTYKLKNIEETEAAKEKLLQTFQGTSEEKELLEQRKEDELRRIAYPLKFGRQSDKEEDWRQRALQKSQQSNERKKRRQAN